MSTLISTRPRDTVATAREMPEVAIQGLPVSLLGIDAAVSRIIEWAAGDAPRMVVTPNTDHYLRWRADAEFRSRYRRADMATADGAPMVLLAAAQGGPVPPRVTGVELFERSASKAAEAGIPLVIIGGAPGVASAAAEELQSRYPGLQVPWVVSPSAEQLRSRAYLEDLSERLAQLPTKVVGLCVGSPKQENLFMELEAVSAQLSGVYLCVGAAVDFVSGRVKRAPSWMQRLGLEWSFRLVMEPRRLWRRYLVDDAQMVRHIALALGKNVMRKAASRAAERRR